MRFVSIDLNLLRVFDAIHAHGSLTKAAEALHISQPAVSKALARLRELYGDPLFTRTPEGMKPTPAAVEIAADVREALQCVRVSLTRGGGFRPELSARHYWFCIGGTIETVVMPRLLHALETEAPKVTLGVYQHPRRDALRELVAGNVDFILDNVLPQHSEVQYMRLCEDDYVCLVRHGHPTINGRISLEQFLALGHINVSSRRGGLNYVDEVLRELRVARRIVLQTQSYLEAPHTLLQTDYVLTLPRSVATRFDAQVLPLPFEVAPIAYRLYWHATAATDSGRVWMRDLLSRLFGVTVQPATGR